MEFSRQEYWSRLPFPFPGDLPKPGVKPRSPALHANSLLSEPPGKSFFFFPLLYQHTNEDIPLLPSSGLKQGLTPSISLQTTWLQKCLKIFGHLFLHLWDISSVSAAAAAVKSAVVSDSVRPHRQQPSRLLCPWDSLGKNTGVGCHCFLWSSVSRSYHKVQALAHDWNIFNTILCYPN